MQNTTRANKHQILFGSLICTIGAIFYCYEFVLRILPGILQNELSAAFGHISASTFGQISALYYFAYSPMQMPVGMLMDRFGPRRLLTLACLCCTLGSLMFSYSHFMLIAGIGRFLVGFGSAFAFVGVLSLAVQWLPPKLFSLVAGLMTTLGMLGIIYGEVKITALAAQISLTPTLLSLVVLGAILTTLIFLVVRDGPNKLYEKKQPLPEFFRSVVQVLLSPQVWLVGMIGACLYTSLSVFGELWGKTYLEQAHHLTKFEAAHTISIMFLGWAIGAPVAGYYSDHTKQRFLPLFLGAFVSLICISIILYYPGLSHFALNSLMFIYGLFSGTEIIIFILAKECSGISLSSTVFAAANMIVTLGGVILQPLAGYVLDLLGNAQWVQGEHIYALINYQVALSILPISLLAVIVLLILLKRFKNCD